MVRISNKRAEEEAAKERLKLGYVHIPKTGGTSICRALKVLDSHDPIWLRKKDENRILKWAATIRNPWDRLRSWFYYYEIHRKRCTFEEWILTGCQTEWRHLPAPEARILYQEDWIEIDGKRNVDYLMRFEDFDDQFALLCLWLGLKPGENLANLKHFHLQRQGYQEIKIIPYWEHYTDDMRKCVAHICEPFAEKYGYKFGE